MNRPLATSALALILAAGPALADVTPAEVWQNLRDSYEQMGYQVQVGSEDAAGDALTLTDVTLSSDEAEAAEFTFTMPQIALTPVGDGTVRSVIDGQMTIVMRDEGPEGEPIGFDMTLDAPGNETISSGTPDDMRHSFVMPTMALSGRALESENDAPLTATLTGVEGVQTMTRAADGSGAQTYEGRADSMEMSLTASGPALDAPEGSEATDDFAATFTISDLTMSGDGTTPAGEVNFGSQPTQALQAGFAGRGTLGMGATTGTFSASALRADGPDQETSGSFEAASGTLAVSMSAEGLSYEGGLTDMAVNLTSSDMPFPIAYAAAENRFRLAMPVVASEEEQPFALTYLLDGLTLDDAIWQAMDPEATLPRDPARLSIDLEGLAVLTRNFMDPDAAVPAEGEMPFLPRSLSIRDFSMSAVGAEADVSGELTFGEDPTQPIGTLSGTFSGVNTFLDRLVAMGVVPAEQLMGPRMMMAMFARPVDGAEDQLQTEIEFREGGSIFANGQQIQ